MVSDIIERAAKVANWISKPSALIGVLGLLGVAVLTIANVIGRWLLDQPLIGIHDLFGLAVIIVVAACFPTGVMQRKHVAIRFLGAWLGPRVSRILDTFGAVFTVAFLAVVAWQVTTEAIEKMSSGEYTLVMKLATGPIWWVAGIVLWLSVPMQLVVIAGLAIGAKFIENTESDLGK